MSDLVIQSPNVEQKRQAILAAAFEVLCQYGFKKTSIEDIAKSAGMSRAAVYQIYRNKADIARSLVSSYYEHLEHELPRALNSDPDVTLALKRGFEAQSGAVLEMVLTSAHGAELLDMKSEVAADLIAEGEAQVQSAYADWIAAGVARGAIDPQLCADAEATARTLIAAFYGLKNGRPSYTDFVDMRDRLAQMFGLALGG